MSGIPYTPEEALIRMALVAVLIVIATLLLKVRKIGIEKEYLYALLKGGAQIFALAVFLTYLFSSPIWYLLIWILLLAMIFGRSRHGNHYSGTLRCDAPCPPVHNTPLGDGLRKFNDHMLADGGEVPKRG